MDLLKGHANRGQPVAWTNQVGAAFTALKEALYTYMVLHSPLPNHPFTVCTDASKIGVGAVLAQQMPQGERPILFLSWKLTPTEQRYALIEKEALAMKWVTDSLRYYLLLTCITYKGLR